MTYKVRVEIVTNAAVTAAAGVAVAAPDATHVVLMSAKVLPFGGVAAGLPGANSSYIVTLWSSA